MTSSEGPVCFVELAFYSVGEGDLLNNDLLPGVCARACMYMCVYVHVYVYLRVCVHARVCMCARACVHVCGPVAERWGK